MKCAEYKELALKRVEIWDEARHRLELTLGSWADIDEELAESVDIDTWMMPEAPSSELDVFDEPETMRRELLAAKSAGEALIEDVREFLNELKRRSEEFERTEQEVRTIIAEARQADTMHDDLSQAMMVDSYESDPLPYLTENTTSLSAAEELVDELRAWANDVTENCEDG